MPAHTLTTEIRSSRGKTAARQLRAQGLIPGVLYGRGAEPIALSLAPKELTRVLSTEHRRNALLQIDIDGTQALAMVKDLQVHPVSREPRHVDLYRVSLEQSVLVPVPLVAQGKAKGVVAGGELNVLYRDLPVRTTPGNIPASIEVDVSGLELGQALRVQDLPLAPGRVVAMNSERNVITCAEARTRPAEDEATPGAPAAGAAAAAAPAAGAPAAGAAPAKPAGKGK
jgi:large subunit ribosomal protein L25